MDILVLFRLVWRRKWIIILVPVLTAIATFYFSTSSRARYKGTAQIATGFATPGQVSYTDERFNMHDADVKFNNLLAIMHSGIVYNLMAYRLILHDLNSSKTPFRVPGERDSASSKELISLVEDKLNRLSPMVSSDPKFEQLRNCLSAYGYNYDYLTDVTTISRIPNTDYVEVAVSTENPNLSAFAANAYCEELIRYDNSIENKQSGESVDFLKQLVERKKTDLDAIMDKLRTIKSNYGLLDVQGESQFAMGKISDLEQKRDELSSNIQGLQLTIQKLQSEISSMQSTSSQGSDANQRIVNLRDQINRLNNRYVSAGSSNKVLLDSLNLLRNQLATVMNNMDASNSDILPNQAATVYDLKSQLRNAQIQIEVARSNYSNTVNALRQVQNNASGYATKEADVASIQKEVDLTTKDYQDATDKYNEAMNKLLASGSLHQAIFASPPVEPESSRRLLIVGLATFASFCLCVFVIACIELLDMTIKTPERFAKTVGLPLMGPLNMIDVRTLNIHAYFSHVSKDPNIELFKSLLRKIRFEMSASEARVIMFTSLRKGEGKTFTIFCLSYALSLIDKRVLIVDTNFKNNSLSRLLGQSEDKSRVIQGKRVPKLLAAGVRGERRYRAGPETEDFYEGFYDLITPTKFKNVFVVCSETGTDSPAEILSGRNFSKLVSILSKSFDFLFLEGAALNDFSDTKELVDHVSGLVAVFSADTTIRSADRESISYLNSLGNKVVGCVLNKVDPNDLKL